MVIHCYEQHEVHVQYMHLSMQDRVGYDHVLFKSTISNSEMFTV